MSLSFFIYILIIKVLPCGRTFSVSLQAMLHEALLGKTLVFSARSAIVGKREDADASTRFEQSGYFYIPWVHQFHKVFHDNIHAILMKIAMVTEAEEIQL